MNEIKFINKIVPISELKEWNKNPRHITKKGLEDLIKSIKKFGVAEPLVLNKDMTICGGHGRKQALKSLGYTEVPCYVSKKQLTENQFEELNIRLNKNIAGIWDFEKLSNEFEISDLIEYGFEDADFGLQVDEEDDGERGGAPSSTDTWTLGKHRLVIIDIFNAKDAEQILIYYKKVFGKDPIHKESQKTYSEFVKNKDGVIYG